MARKPPPRKPGRPKGTTKFADSVLARLSYAQLDPIDRAMLAIVGARPVITNTDLAKQMGMGTPAVKKRRDRGIFQLELLRLQKPAIEKCKEAQSEAADAIIDLLKSKDEKIRLQAAQTLLKPIIPQTSVVKHETGFDITIGNMTPEELDNFIKKGLDGLTVAGSNIDALSIPEESVVDQDEDDETGD